MSYRDLKSYQGATMIYDFTVEFCKTYMTYQSNKSYRMTDQMVQAARSGKQNIVEGSVQRTSQKGELKLLGVSRASFQELLEDYEDFLRQKGFPLWSKDSPSARKIRDIAYRSDKSYQSYRTYLSSPADAANVMVCLINQVNFLLDQQIRALEKKFVEEGGYSENLLKRRISYLHRTDRSDKSN